MITRDVWWPRAAYSGYFLCFLKARLVQEDRRREITPLQLRSALAGQDGLVVNRADAFLEGSRAEARAMPVCRITPGP